MTMAGNHEYKIIKRKYKKTLSHSFLVWSFDIVDNERKCTYVMFIFPSIEGRRSIFEVILLCNGFEAFFTALACKAPFISEGPSTHGRFSNAFLPVNTAASKIPCPKRNLSKGPRSF